MQGKGSVVGITEGGGRFLDWGKLKEEGVSSVAELRLYGLKNQGAQLG